MEEGRRSLVDISEGAQKSDPEIRRANQRWARTRSKSKATAAVRVPPRGQALIGFAPDPTRARKALRDVGALRSQSCAARAPGAHTAQFGNAPFGDDGIDVRARRRHRLDMATMRLPPFGRGRRQRDDRPASRAALAPRTKSSWPPMAPTATPFSVSALTLPSRPTSSAELIATSRLTPRQHPLAVRIGRRPDRDGRVLVRKAVEPLRADQLVGDT